VIKQLSGAKKEAEALQKAGQQCPAELKRTIDDLKVLQELLDAKIAVYIDLVDRVEDFLMNK
jgi:hypothetical protein